MAIYNPTQKIRHWNIAYFSGSGIWTDDGKICRAGIDPFSIPYETSAQTLILADGSQARTSPENYRTFGEITLMFPAEQLTSAYKTKLKALYASGAGIRITTHEASNVYLEGYMNSLEDTWLLSGDKQKHVYKTRLQLFDVDGSGGI